MTSKKCIKMVHFETPTSGRILIKESDVVQMPSNRRGVGMVFQNGIPSNSHLKGTLANVIFLGSIVRLVINTGRSELLMDTFNNPHLALPALGSDVTVGFEPEACVPLEKSESGSAATSS